MDNTPPAFTQVQEVTKIEPPKPMTKPAVGKSNSTKSIKVPTVVHSEINLLDPSWMKVKPMQSCEVN